MFCSRLLCHVCLLLLLAPLLSAQPTVTVDWSNVTLVTTTTPTLQLVGNPLILRQSPIHDAVFSNLRRLNTTYARYATWFPYPGLSVPSLDPPSGLSQCRDVAAGYNVSLSCARGGGVIDAVQFASFGVPDGVCGAFVNTSCHAASSIDVVSKLCAGQKECVVPASTALFGDPCPAQADQYRLAVQVTCDPPQNNTYWDFSEFDPAAVDFLRATEGGSPIVEFCTSPAWLWNQSGQPVHHYPSNPWSVDWSYNTGDALLDPTCTQIGQWFGRLAAWYTQGGLYDEYGHFHESGHAYDLRLWEVLNEEEAEHSVSPELYTCIYDQVVKYVREYADPKHQIEFVGIAAAYANHYAYYTYFLNASNHLPGTPLDWISYHNYATPADRNSVAGYEAMFDQFDAFLGTVDTIEQIRLSLSPSTRTTIDEAGCILPGDPGGPGDFPLTFWSACNAAWIYLLAHVQQRAIDVIGHSQLVGLPALPDVMGGLDAQFPSVALLNWTTGAGTQNYHGLDLAIRQLSAGNCIVSSRSTNSTDVFAQAYADGRDGREVRKVLLVNKRSTQQQVTVAGAAGGEMWTVDDESGEKPARREKVAGDTIILAPFAVSVVHMPASPSLLDTETSRRSGAAVQD